MARQQNIGNTKPWFAGMDVIWQFEIYASTEATMLDVSAFTLRCVVRKRGESNAIVIDKTSSAGIAVAGTFNSDPDTNLQRVSVTIPRAATLHLPPGDYDFALGRTDSGSYDVYSYGTATLTKAPL